MRDIPFPLLGLLTRNDAPDPSTPPGHQMLSAAAWETLSGHGLIIMANADRGDALWRELVEAIGTP